MAAAADKNGWYVAGACFGLILLFLFVVFVTPLAFMLLWNWIVPEVLKHAVTELTYWQSFGLLLMVGLVKGSHVACSRSATKE